MDKSILNKINEVNKQVNLCGDLFEVGAELASSVCKTACKCCAEERKQLAEVTAELEVEQARLKKIDMELYHMQPVTVGDVEGQCKACLYDLVEEVGCTCNDVISHTNEELTMTNSTNSMVNNMAKFNDSINKIATDMNLTVELEFNGRKAARLHLPNGYAISVAPSDVHSMANYEYVVIGRYGMMLDDPDFGNVEDILAVVAEVAGLAPLTEELSAPKMVQLTKQCVGAEIASLLEVNEDNVEMLTMDTKTNPNEETKIMNIQTVSDSALASIITSNVFHKIGCAQKAVLISCALVDALDHKDYFLEMFVHTVENAQLRAVLDNVSTELTVDMDMEAIGQMLVDMEYMTDEGKVGAKLEEVANIAIEAYAPTTEEIVRRYPTYKLEKGQASPLLLESIHAQEKTMFTIDKVQLELANKVQALIGGSEADDEAYVLAGCNKMNADKSYHSEFMADRRGRTYQAACHGPIFAASDRSRSLSDLVGVPTDYDIEVVKAVIMAEMEDMTSSVKDSVIELNAIGDVQFVINHLKKGTACKKPYSFVKAVRIMRELKLGNRPYIGMAAGKDAKCSGPQLGALMIGDEELAAACGMSMEQVEDAYERCVQTLAKFGFVGFTRNGIKKPFMGVFYGQGFGAFTNVAAMSQEEDMKEVVAILAPLGIVPDDVAKAFHKAITLSFGKKLVALRNRFKEFAGKIEGRTSHFMPDGFKVQMNYKVKWNVLNEEMEYGVKAPDVHVVTGEMTRKFIGMQLKTKMVHTGDFVRNGFVNMIQGTDALIARLIVAHLSRLGAKHIISVHDCFRVNVTEMHLLDQAIINAYQDLFGTQVNCKTVDMPLGQDVLGLYFEGVSKSLKAGEKVVPMPQFLPFGPKPRKMVKIGEHKLSDVINALGTSYYFDK